jgi:FtsP/CotA-like multicopper oxidase with cupredoxin domain
MISSADGEAADRAAPEPTIGAAEQVYADLAGVLLVTDEEEQALGPPSEYAVDDLPLVLQDAVRRLGIPHGVNLTTKPCWCGARPCASAAGAAWCGASLARRSA